MFDCGPVSQLAIAAAWRLGAGRMIAVDNVASRLEMARSQHAEPVDFSAEYPVAVIGEFTGSIGADRVIDAVGVDDYSLDGKACMVVPRPRLLSGLSSRWLRPAQHRNRRCLPTSHAALADWGGDKQEPDGEDGQLPAPSDHPATGGDGPGYTRRRRGRGFSAKGCIDQTMTLRDPALHAVVCSLLHRHGGKDEVAEFLGNTRAVARVSYVDPRVLQHYVEGRTILAAVRRAGPSAFVDEKTRARLERELLRLLHA